MLQTILIGIIARIVTVSNFPMAFKKRSALLLCCALVTALWQPVHCQQQPETEEEIKEEPSTQISPRALEVAHELQIDSILESYLALKNRGPYPSGSKEYLDLLSLKQELLESVVAAMLEIHGVTAEIDYEIAQAADLREFLSDRRDRAIKFNTWANIVSGAISSGVGNSLDMAGNNNNTIENSGDLVEVVAGAVQTGLAVLALKQDQGEARTVPPVPNMLAQLFDRTPGSAQYPQPVWEFLNAVPPDPAAKVSRRKTLINRWTRLGVISDLKRPGSSKEIEMISSTGPGKHKVTIDLLETRSMMLSDLRALVLQMERGLLELLKLIRKT